MLVCRTPRAREETVGAVLESWKTRSNLLFHWITRLSAGSGSVAVAVNVTELSPALVAVVVFGPAAGPNCQPPRVAIPVESVNSVAPKRLPPPVTSPHVTLTPGTGLLSASVTSTHTTPWTRVFAGAIRSEERRVGKECRSRW